MDQIHKYAYRGKSGLILTDSRPGGKQWDHVTAYGLFKERLRILEADGSEATLGELVQLITTMRNNHDKLITSYQKPLEPTSEAEQPRMSTRILIEEAKRALTEAQLALKAAENKLNETKPKKNSQNQDEKAEYTRALAGFNSEKIKRTTAQKVLIDAIANAPFKNELDETIDDMLAEVKKLTDSAPSHEAITRAINIQENEKDRNSISSMLQRGKQKDYDEAITQLANIYLIFKNKQQYSAFPSMGSILPLKGEAKRVTNAMAMLREIELMPASRSLQVQPKKNALTAINDLFWYPKIPEGVLIGDNPKKLAAFRKKYPSKIEPRSNDLQIAAFVVAEHLEMVFACYPRLNPELRKVLTERFIEVFSKDWKLKRSERDHISQVIKSYLIDEESAASSSSSNSQSLASSGQLDTSESFVSNISSGQAPESKELESTSGTDADEKKINNTGTSSISEHQPEVAPATSEHSKVMSTMKHGIFSRDSALSAPSSSSAGHEIQPQPVQQLMLPNSELGKRDRDNESPKAKKSQKNKGSDNNIEQSRKKR